MACKNQTTIRCKAVDYAKGHENNVVQALKICWERRIGTSTVLSVMEWRQPSRLPTTSSGDICTPACKLHKTPASKLRIVTLDKESSMNTLWQEEEFEQIYSRESLTEKAAEIPKTVFVKHCRVEILAFSFVLFHRDLFFNFCCFFCQRFSAAYLLKLFVLLQHVHTTLFISCDNSELTRCCLCSLHAGIHECINISR